MSMTFFGNRNSGGSWRGSSANAKYCVDDSFLGISMHIQALTMRFVKRTGNALKFASHSESIPTPFRKRLAMARTCIGMLRNAKMNAGIPVTTGDNSNAFQTTPGNDLEMRWNASERQNDCENPSFHLIQCHLLSDNAWQ